MTPADDVAAAPLPDLTQCDREPIHLLGQVQPWGFLLSADDTETIRHASANVATYLGHPAAAVIGGRLDSLLQPEALHDIRARLQGLQGQHQTDRIFALPLIAGQPPYDVALHLAPGDPSLFVLEAEPSVAEPGFDALTTVKGMMARLMQAANLPSLHDRAARQLRSVLGFDRVMVYRFDTDGSGEVVGEAAAPGLESFRGLHYPASDIPAQARALYCRNWLRLIADIGAPTVAILPTDTPPLDLSSAVLRSVSPVHIEYLRNMGVAASLSISIMRGDQLWGLLACHHNRPLLPSFTRRSAAELFGQLYSFQVESRERAEAAAHDRAARAVLQRVVAVLAGDADLGERLQRLASEVRGLLPCDGVAIRNAGRIELIGATPDAALLGDILDTLGRAEPAQVFVTTEIARLHPAAGANAPAVVGMLAIPISHTRQDYLAFFRAEKIHSVTWAGNPEKPVQPGIRQSPRQSFEAWRQTVRGQSAAWTEAELRSAEALRVAMLEAVLRQLGRTVNEQHRSATDRQDLLINELNHRVRNVLGLIRALVARSLTSATTLEGFVIALNGRIQALARAHDQLTEDHWGPVALRGMVESELHAYLGAGGPSRAVVSGPPVLVEPQALTVLALVVHELATNAVKYGALSGDHGIVAVSWRLKDDGALAMTW